MAAPIFQRTVVDTQGNVVAGAVVEVRNEATDELAPIFVDRPLTDVKANPFTTDSTGFIRFFAAAGDYRIKATFGAEEIIFRFVQLIDTDELIDFDSVQTLNNKTLTSPSIIGTSTTNGDAHLTNNVAIGDEVRRLQWRNSTFDIASIRAFVGAGQQNRGEIGFFVNDGATQKLAQYIDRSGNIGIGTTSPGSLVDVVQSASGTSTGTYPSIRVRNTNTSTTSFADFQCLAENGAVAGQLAAVFSGGERFVRLAALTNHYLQFMTNSTERMRIDSAGNVGIGTSSPSRRLHISAAGTDCAVRVDNTVSGRPFIITYDDSQNLNFINSSDTGYIGFVNGTGAGFERMRIDSAGNVGIGTSSPSAQLHINNLNSNSSATIRLEGRNRAGIIDFYNDIHNAARFSSDQSGNFSFSNSGFASSTLVDRLFIESNGSLILVGSTAQKATGTTWSNPSDERLKDNIRDYGKGIAELMQVRVREWEYNGKGGTVQGTKGLGVVADEVMVVLPDTVANYEAKLNADDEEVTAIKKFDATEITWLLVKTVQEQQAIIESLKARLDAANI